MLVCAIDSAEECIQSHLKLKTTTVYEGALHQSVRLLGVTNSLSGMAHFGCFSEEFIPQQIATLWIASFLLFWASAIFFCSHDWSQISHRMFLTCGRDFKWESPGPWNCREYWSESSILWKARLRLFGPLFYDAALSCPLFTEVGQVKRKELHKIQLEFRHSLRKQIGLGERRIENHFHHKTNVLILYSYITSRSMKVSTLMVVLSVPCCYLSTQPLE